MDFNLIEWWHKQNNLGRVLVGVLALIIFAIGSQITPPRPASIHFGVSFLILLTILGLFFLNQKGKTNLAAHLLLIVLYLPLWLYYFINVKINDFFGATLLASVMVGVGFISTTIIPTKSVLIFSTTTVIFLYLSNQLYPASIEDTQLLQQSLLVLFCLSTALGWTYNKKQQLSQKNQRLVAKKQTLSQENQQIQHQNQELLAKFTATSQQIESVTQQLTDLESQNQNLLQELQHIKAQNKTLLQKNKHMQQQNVQLQASNQHIQQQNVQLQASNQQIQQQNIHLQQANTRLQSELTTAYKKADLLLEDLKQTKQSLKESTQEKALALTRLEEAQRLLEILYEKSSDAPPPPLGEVHLVGTVGNEKKPTPYNDNGDIIFTLHVVNLQKPQYLFKYKVLVSGSINRGVRIAPDSPLYVVGDLKTMHNKHLIRRTKRGRDIAGVDIPQIHATFIQNLNNDDLQLNKTFAVYINTLRTHHLRQDDEED